jgi:Brp/Blh family beta-carotene 15,15'-monooxygenase
MHAPVYLAICTISIATVLWFGTPELSTMVMFAAVPIAVLGVPHGGLDHWTGRQLLNNRFAGRWWLVFFPIYMMVAIIAGLGWLAAPSLSLVFFFLLSAWHFGREDQKATNTDSTTKTGRDLMRSLQAMAVGGLVIWIPAIVRGEEFHTLLATVLPPGNRDAAIQIVDMTQMLAMLLIPLAIIRVVSQVVALPTNCHAWIPVGTIAISIGLPILLSFAIYFSFWHSWQGLLRLRREQSLSPARFALSVAPLSIVAIALIGAGGAYLHGVSTTGDLSWHNSMTLRTVFIGLSTIAVPHVLLHELQGVCSALLTNRPDRVLSHGLGG